jgi:hypothetical protein
MIIEFIARKTPSFWVFDHEHQNTINEPLCNGTDDVLDQYYETYTGIRAKDEDELRIFASTEQIDNFNTILCFESTDDYGTIYLDMTLLKKVWLCPWLQSYFGHKPEKLYVKITPVNSNKMSDEEFDQIMSGVTDKEMNQWIAASYQNGGLL